MSVINDVLDAVRALAQATEPYATIKTGALPADNSISMTSAGGGDDSVFMSRASAYSIPVVLNGKHRDQQTVTDALNDIHEALTRAAEYPSSGKYQITKITTISAPAYLGNDGGQWLYGSSLRVSFYFRKD